MGIYHKRLNLYISVLSELKEMIKVNRSFTLLIIIAMILNSFAYAQNSKQDEMMKPFMIGALSEDEMHSMAKHRFGDNFSEMEFQKGILQFKERMNRKDAFSYENEGFAQRYDLGPSYEGYSKEKRVFGMIFEHIGDDIDPREIKKYCNDPNKIAGIIIGKLKDKIGDLQNICNSAEELESKCAEYVKRGCYQIGTSIVRNDSTEMEKIMSVAFSCPANKEAIIQACKIRSKAYTEQRMKYSDESCKKRFDFEGDRLLKECERFRQYQICDKGKFISQCMGGIKKEDFEQRKPCPAYPIPQCGEGTQLKTKIDDNGCTYYYCEPSPIPCPIIECVEGYVLVKDPLTGCPKCRLPNSTPQATCKETDNGYEIYVKGTTYSDGTSSGKSDICINDKTLAEYGCNADGSYGGDRQFTCEFGCRDGACLRSSVTTTTTCPEPITPTCASGTIVEKKIDSNNCVYYYCSRPTCSSVQKPTCNPDETLQAYSDNLGCITSYQCIRQTTGCPEVAKPTCSEGQSLTTKYGDKGCIVGYECISVTTTASVTKITGNAVFVLNNYDDLLRHCENSWLEQQKTCSNLPSVCDKNTFIEKCKEQEKENYGDFSSKIEQHCEIQTSSEIKSAEQRCSRIDEDRQRCLEESAKRCEQMKGIAQKCKDLLTEENLRDFIMEEAKKRCKFAEILQDADDIRNAEKAEIVLAVLNTASKDDISKLELYAENLKEELKLQDTTVYKGIIEPNRFGDIKLLPFVVNAKLSAVSISGMAKDVKAKIVERQRIKEAAGKLASLRDSDVPAKYLYIIEDKAGDVLNVSDNMNEIEKNEEQKGFGYKIRLFLGLAKKSEKEEITRLAESKEKLKNSIETLTKLIDEVPSDVAKAVLKEQIENLKQQQENIEVLIEAKEKKAKGLFGLFG